jgi:hypothetical protein
MQGMGSPFPHARRIQESFGGHSIGHLRAHVDGNARELTQQSRAKGMTKGYRTAFAKTDPSVQPQPMKPPMQRSTNWPM